MSKLTHLLQMILTLQYKQFTTASELAGEFEVDKKTIYRYIETLNMANIPIKTKKGRYGGFYINEEFYMKEPNLTEDELEALLMAGEILNEENGFIYEKPLKRAITKIKNVTLHDNESLKDFRSRIEFKISNVGNLESLDNIISKINSAMVKNRSVEISYFSMNKDSLTQRMVDPYAISFRMGAWYLIGYCHLRESVRLFKISRIRKLTITNNLFFKPLNFSVKEYMKNSWGTFRGELTRVVIKFDKKAAAFVKESRWHESQEIEELKDGSILFKVYVSGVGEIKRWVLGFGSEAEVMEPNSLRDEISEDCMKLTNLYEKI